MKLLALLCVLCVCSLSGIAASSEPNAVSNAAVKAAVAPGSVPAAAQQQMAAGGAQPAAAAPAKPAAAAGDAAAAKVSAAAYRDKASSTTPSAQPQQAAQPQAFAAQMQQQQQQQQFFTAAPGVQYVAKPAAYQQPPVTAYVPQYQVPMQQAPYALAYTTPPGAAAAVPYKPAVQYVAQQPYAAPYTGPQYTVAPPQYPEGAYAYPQPQPQPQPQYQYYPAPSPPKSYSSYEEKKPEYDSYKGSDKYESKGYDKYDKHDKYEKSADKYEKSSDKYEKYEKSSDKYYDSYDSKEDYYEKDYYGKDAPPPPAGICQSSTFGAFYTQAVDIDIDEPNDLDGVVSAFVGCNERTTLGGECRYVCYDGEHYERFVGVVTRIVASPPQDWDSVDPWYHPVYCAWALGGNVTDFRAAAPNSKKTAKPGAKQDLPPLFSCDFTIRVECCDDVVPLVPVGPEIDLGEENGDSGGVGSSGTTRKIRRRLTRNGQPVAQIAAVRDSPAFTPIKHSKVTGGFMGLQKRGAGTTKASTSGLAAGDAAAAAKPEQQQPAAAAKPRARAGHTLGQSVMAVQQKA